MRYVKGVLTIIVVLFYGLSKAQSIRLDNLVEKAYSKPYDISIIKGIQLSYVIPNYVSFIDTSNATDQRHSFNLVYHINEAAFERYLKNVHAATVLVVYYNELLDGEMEITLEISKTKDDQYFGLYKFLTFVDKRRIKLIYNKSRSKWEYSSTLKVYDEPRVGNN